MIKHCINLTFFLIADDKYMAKLVCLKSKRHRSPRYRQCDDILQLFDNALDFYLFDNIADVQIYGLKTAFCFDVFSSRSSSNDNHENVLLSRGFESRRGQRQPVRNRHYGSQPHQTHRCRNYAATIYHDKVVANAAWTGCVRRFRPSRQQSLNRLPSDGSASHRPHPYAPQLLRTAAFRYS